MIMCRQRITLLEFDADACISEKCPGSGKPTLVSRFGSDQERIRANLRKLPGHINREASGDRIEQTIERRFNGGRH
jgi:hypothetical protein